MAFSPRFPAFLLLLVSPALAQHLVPLTAENLNKQAVTLPDAARGKTAVVLTGFSHASQNSLKPWTDQLRKDFGSDSRVVVYQAAILEDVPRFIRGMVVSGIRKGTPAAEMDRFLTVFQNKKLWQDTFGYSQPDDAYLIVLDPQGNIRGKHHGAFQASEYAKIKAEISQ